MKLIKQGESKTIRYIFECSFKDKDVAKNAGFRWSVDERVWVTNNTNIASSLIEYVESTNIELIAELQASRTEMQVSQLESRANDSDLFIPMPIGVELKGYQKAGVAFALKRKNTLIADDMGLGKTIQAISFINVNKPMRVLIICPASLKLNWYKEFCKFCIHNDYLYNIVDTKTGIDKSANVNIINYDILSKFITFEKGKLDSVPHEFDLIVADEVNYIKNEKSVRTQSFMKGYNAKNKIALTGTPITNGKPIEMFNMLRWLECDLAKNKGTYQKRYCNAHIDKMGFWNDSGASNLEELQNELRKTVMVRRLKSDVLKELPAKTRQVIELEGLSSVEKSNQLNLIQKYEDVVNRLNRGEMAMQLGEMAKARKELAIKKLPKCIEHVKHLLEDVQKIIIFAHHKEVIEKTCEALKGFGVVSIMGATAMHDRDAAVTQFQNNPNARVFVGSMQACATGLTLTASNTVVFFELDWVPATLSQAEDRAHRIGQTNNVLVQHIVYDGSLDAYIAQKVIYKQNINNRTVN